MILRLFFLTSAFLTLSACDLTGAKDAKDVSVETGIEDTGLLDADGGDCNDSYAVLCIEVEP